jgi:hypothetical protein
VPIKDTTAMATPTHTASAIVYVQYGALSTLYRRARIRAQLIFRRLYSTT